MSTKKTLITLCATVVAFTHVGAEAASGMDGLKACVSVLARELAKDRETGIEVRISDETSVSNHRLRGPSRYYLDAHHPGTEEVVARVNCDVDSMARVKRLIRLPKDAPDASIRSL